MDEFLRLGNNLSSFISPVEPCLSSRLNKIAGHQKWIHSGYFSIGRLNVLILSFSFTACWHPALTFDWRSGCAPPTRPWWPTMWSESITVSLLFVVLVTPWSRVGCSRPARCCIFNGKKPKTVFWVLAKTFCWLRNQKKPNIPFFTILVRWYKLTH